MRFDGTEVQAWSHDGQQFSMEVSFLAQPRTHAVGHFPSFDCRESLARDDRSQGNADIGKRWPSETTSAQQPFDETPHPSPSDDVPVAVAHWLKLAMSGPVMPATVPL